MPFVLLTAGLLMIVTGAKGTYVQFGKQVAADFTGPGNFTYWIVAIGAVGALGYVDALRVFSRMFMTLIIIAMLLSNRGFFAKLTEALKTGPIAPKAIGSTASASPGPSAAPTTAAPTPTFKESLQKPGGGGFWDFIGAPGIGNWLFGPSPAK